MSSKVTSYTAKIDKNQAEKIKDYLINRGFVLSSPQYTFYSAKSPEVVVSAYQSGKLLVQGKGTQDFVEFFLEPEILKAASLGYELELSPEQLQPHIGVDESGKGDFFGPLVVSAVYLNESAARTLHQAGIQDSKAIKSDKKIGDLAEIISKTPGVVVDVVAIGNEAYNRLYNKFRNLNQLLAWGHARAIENVTSKIDPSLPHPDFILSDQFARSKSTVENAMFGASKAIPLKQRTKAESDIAVAAASICARHKFVTELQKYGQSLHLKLLKGASGQVKELAKSIFNEFGAEKLATVSKKHFKTFDEVVKSATNSKKL